MDLTYIVLAIGSTNILFNYETGLESPYFLFVLTSPCGQITKSVIFTPSSGCDLNWILTIVGTQEIYEDLEAGQIYFNENGTWTGSAYYQSSPTNTNPENANFVTDLMFQIR